MVELLTNINIKDVTDIENNIKFNLIDLKNVIIELIEKKTSTQLFVLKIILRIPILV